MQEPCDLPTSVREELVELERAAGQREHASRRIALVEQSLAGRELQRPSEIPELLEARAIEDPADRLVTHFTPLTGVSGRQRFEAPGRCDHDPFQQS